MFVKLFNDNVILVEGDTEAIILESF
ncbi:TOPRIM nucleotidyl transferase/hydrolase domain-containing protein [Planococcus sp. MB-3u-03]